MITYKDVPGWMDWESLYDEVAYTTPPYATVVEVGIGFGRSLIYLAQQIKRIGRPGVRIIAVDPWVPYDEMHFIYKPETATTDYERECAAFAARHGGVYEAFRWALDASGCADIVDVLRMPSVLAASFMFGGGGPKPPHFVFIDGSHRAEDVQADLDAWWALGPEWMGGHDYNRDSEHDFPGVWKSVDAKFGRANVEWSGQPGPPPHTCFVVRRSHLERPR
jgi:hypothetical protein